MDAYQEQTIEGRKKSLTAYADQIRGWRKSILIGPQGHQRGNKRHCLLNLHLSLVTYVFKEQQMDNCPSFWTEGCFGINSLLIHVNVHIFAEIGPATCERKKQSDRDPESDAITREQRQEQISRLLGQGEEMASSVWAIKKQKKDQDPPKGRTNKCWHHLASAWDRAK